MTGLLERARRLMASKPAVLGALVIVPLATAAKTAEAAVTGAYTLSMTKVFLFSPTSGGQITFPGSVSATGVNPLIISTNSTITVPATTYDNDVSSSFDIAMSGNLNPVFFPVNASTITIDYDFIVGLAGTRPGSVTWSLDSTIGGQTLDASSTSALTAASTEVSGTLSLPVTTALTSTWSSTLALVWTGYTGDGQLTLTVPAATSLDFGVTATPEPASLSVLGLGVMGLLMRRRRKEGAGS